MRTCYQVSDGALDTTLFFHECIYTYISIYVYEYIIIIHTYTCTHRVSIPRPYPHSICDCSACLTLSMLPPSTSVPFTCVNRSPSATYCTLQHSHKQGRGQRGSEA